MRKTALKATAFHEAGHAVIAWRFRLKVRSATIVPTIGTSGEVASASPLRGIHLDHDGSDRAHQRAETAIIVYLAGPAAQRRHSPHSWRSYHGRIDHSAAADLALRLNGSVEVTNAHLKYLVIVARDMVAASWAHIERVADALVERGTLTGDEVAALGRPATRSGIRVSDDESGREGRWVEAGQ